MMNEKGFSLIGVLISCILVTAITSLLFTQQMIVKQTMNSQHRINAANIAQEAIELLTDENLNIIDNTTLIKQIVENDMTFDVETIITYEEFLNMGKVQVIVSWKEWGVVHNVALETLLPKKISS